jgi:hypothetical protein
MFEQPSIRLVVYTTVTENDGHWKASSDEYVVAYITLSEAAKGETYLYNTYVLPNQDNISVKSFSENYDYAEYITGWSLLFDGELTWHEEAQFEYDGYVTYPTKPIGEQWTGAWLPIDSKKFFTAKQKV